MGNVPPSLSAVAAAIAAANTKKHDGVRIKAPHYLEQHDEHRSWTSNKTWHFETGWVYHVTAGQVLHQNLNLAEIHTTTNVLTMHVDLTPLNVHLGQKVLGMDVHIEKGHGTKVIKYHDGHHTHVVRKFDQIAQEVHIKSSQYELSDDDKLVNLGSNAPARPGTMTLEADGDMTLRSTEKVELFSGPDNTGASLRLLGTDDASLFSNDLTTVRSSNRTIVRGGDNSGMVLETGRLKLNCGNATVSLSPGKLETNGDNTKLNGTVHIGQPAISGMATVDALQRETSIRKYQDITNTYDILAIKNKLGM